VQSYGTAAVDHIDEVQSHGTTAVSQSDTVQSIHCRSNKISHLASTCFVSHTTDYSLLRLVIVLCIKIGVRSQLHAECGAAFTSKLDGMFRDIELSKELREAYRQFAQNQSDASSSSSSLSSSSSSSSSSRSSAASSAADLLEAQVLTQGVWPPYADAVGAGGGELPVPVEVVRAQEAFKNFYLSKHTGMRWVVGGDERSWGSWE
jgi:hypothetical protein